MRLERLEVANVRCIEAAVLEPARGLNVIEGPNGAGKTAVLEAIHVLASGRSFRAGGMRELIRVGAPVLSVRGRVQGRAGARVISVERGSAQAEISVDRRAVRSAAELAAALPVVVLDVGSAELVEGGPKSRRRWLDTTLFHVEPGYLELWLRYHRALRQRNAALAMPTAGPSGTPFDRRLAREAEALTDARRRMFESLRDRVLERSKTLLGHSIELTYRQGWSEGQDYASELRMRLQADRDTGSTLAGPHRADLSIRTGDRALRHHASRGQGKLAACLLLLAQAACIEDGRGESPLLLVDDVAAELDAGARDRMIAALEETRWQVFLTTTDARLLSRALEPRLFHVEQGRVTG
jgi:DNA replication and repair protein RecF